MELKKLCPMRFASRGIVEECSKEKCAWWCSWAECCAVVAISAEISDRAHDIMQTMED